MRNKGIFLTLIFFYFLIVSLVLAAPYSLTMTDESDFSGGDFRNVIIFPDPSYPPAGLTLSEFDTIRVLQIFPSGHCMDCIDIVVDSLAPFGNPVLHFDLEITTLDDWNDISGLSDNFQVADPISLELSNKVLTDYDIIFFGIANGFGGRGNDLDNSGRERVRDFAGLGRGVILTHDTIAKREGRRWYTMLCSESSDFEHERFNSITDVTGLDADWVTCYAPDSDSHYFEVHRVAGTPDGANVLHAPFDLPDTFAITACHNFGEEYDGHGTVWYEGPRDQIYMHTYHSLDYGSYAAYFSTGHEEEYHGDSFRPSPWEGKAMINAMYYAYFGGHGSGIYTSESFSAICDGELTTFSMDIDTADGSGVTVELASSSDGFSWSDFYIIEPGMAVPSAVSDGPFYMYRLIFQRGVYGERPIVHSITWEFELPIPELELVSPSYGSFYSCSCGVVEWYVRSQSGVDLSSVIIDVNSTAYGPSRCSWDTADSILTFLGPSECWTHGETYLGYMEEMTGITGCPRVGDTSFYFIADLRPPTITNLIPAPDTIIAESDPILFCTLHDSTSDEQNSTFYWIVDGDTIDYGEAGLSWNGTINQLRLNTIVAGLTLGDTVEVCVGGGDIAEGCGPNMADTCWSFLIDQDGPTATIISPPTGYLSCDSLRLAFIIEDLVGLDNSSLIVSCGEDTFIYPDGMRFAGDTFYLEPDYPVNDGDTLNIVFEQIHDMLGNSGGNPEFTVIVDQTPPVVWNRDPYPDGFVGVSDPDISFSLMDSISGLSESSVRITVDGVDYDLSDGSWDGVNMLLSGSSLGWDFEHDDSIEICVWADDFGSGCGTNQMMECWSFIVNLRGPECIPVGPLDGWYVGCDTFHILFMITDPNGVNWSTAEFSIDGVVYNISSPQIALSSDTVDFTPSVPWIDGDVISVEITAADDSLGNTLESPCLYSFTVDLTPPEITEFNPVHYGVVDTSQPIISARIEDIAGVDSSSLVLCAESDCWGLDSLPPGLIWRNDSLIFDPNAAGVYFAGETVMVRVEACDRTQWCGPNCGSEIWMFLIDNLGPRAFLIEPDSGAFSSCSSQVFKSRIVDPSGLMMNTIEILANGISVNWPDPRLDYIGDTLIFTPDSPWNHLDTVEFELISVFDSIGNPLQDTIFTEVIIDLMPPNVEIISPLPGESDVPPLSNVLTVITDDGCGLVFDQTEFYVNGYFVAQGSGLGFRGDTLVFDPVAAGMHFIEGDSNSVRIVASDCAGYCPSNVTDTTWRFYVPDDDSIGPIWIDYQPTFWLADSVFAIECRAFDESGIYSASPPDLQAPYLIWDNDSDLVANCDTSWLDFVDESAGTTRFITSSMLVSHDPDSDIVLMATCWDDDNDYSESSDRSNNVSPLWPVEIVEPADIDMTFPMPEWVTSCRDQAIRFSVSGEVALDMGSCIFVIDGDTVSTLDSRLTAESDSAFQYTPLSEIFDDGQIVCTLIEAKDALGNPLYVPMEWTFIVDTLPPVIVPLSPSEGAMVPEDQMEFEISINDPICGIDTDYLKLGILVNQTDSFTFDINNSVLDWNEGSGLLSFNPDNAGMGIEDGDSLLITICAGDNPDLCSPNEDCLDFSYWIEPHVECSTNTNPFTPNMDGYNDVVRFYWPHFFRFGADIEIFDMRGIQVKKYSVPPGNFKAAEWNGLDENENKCPGGVYIYVVEVNGERICKGTITLAR